MPPQVLVYTLDASERREGDSAAAGDVVDEVRPQLEAIMAASGAEMVDREDMVKCGLPCARFFRWGGVASLEIGLQREQIRNFGLHSVADWWFAGDLAAVRAALDADFALFAVLKQTRQTTGRKVVIALGGGYTYGKQIDVACLTDLHDGHMTWCRSERDDSADLADRGQIPAVMKKLLAGPFRVAERQ
jgi:hypothetical protein